MNLTNIVFKCIIMDRVVVFCIFKVDIENILNLLKIFLWYQKCQTKEHPVKLKALASLALNNFDVMCYIVNIDSFELLYANDLAVKTFSPFCTEFVEGKKCYDFLHGKESVCDICNIHLLQENQKLYTDIQNEKNRKYYTHIDSIIEHEGSRLKLTFAYDLSKQREEIDTLTQKISIEETLIKCIQIITKDTDFDKALINLLSVVCQFYEADRAYLYEINRKEMLVRNTHEWSVNPMFASKDENRVISYDGLASLIEALETKGELNIKNVEKELDHTSAIYKILVANNSKTAMMVPVFSNNEVNYFMGVNNSKSEIKDLTLLHSIILFVTEELRKSRVRKQLEHLSYTDVLTGLSNRNKYLERVESINIKELSSLGYLHVNINALKKMNELYGELYGDSVIKQVACTLSKYVKSDLFRVSGDEFIGIFPNITQEAFDHLIQRLRKDEQEDVEFAFAVGGVWQSKNIDIRQGLTQAGDIMVSDKQSFYKNQVTERVQSRLNPFEILLDEINSNLFTVYLQPKVNLSTGVISSAEALVRKFSHEGKIISPDRFIPIYENESTIRYLDYFVLEEVCKLLQKLIIEGRPLPIAVNFSRVSCIAYDLIDEVVNICDKYNVPHKYIKIELTESIDKMDFDFFHKKIIEFNELGFEVSLDDFGAKHSNLLMLTMEEFSEVKIDKSLVDNILTSAKNRTVVRNVIKTVREFGQTMCVAEGVETKEQVALLKDLGCSYGQGYYFYRPMPFDEFLNTYTTNESQKSLEIQEIGKATKRNYIVNYDELHSIVEAMPFAMFLWNNKNEVIMCNQHVVDLFELESRDDLFQNFLKISPEIQPDGKLSSEKIPFYQQAARESGSVRFNWMHVKLDGEEIPAEVTLVKLDVKSEDGEHYLAAYLRDLRPQLAGTDEAAWASEYFFNEISDKTLFNTISEIAAEFFWVYNNRAKNIQFFGKGREILGLPKEKMAFPESIIEGGITTDDTLEEFLLFSKAMEEGRHYPIHVKFNLPDGIEHFFKIDYKIIFDANNKPLFCIGKTSDISEQMLEMCPG